MRCNSAIGSRSRGGVKSVSIAMREGLPVLPVILSASAPSQANTCSALPRQSAAARLSTFLTIIADHGRPCGVRTPRASSAAPMALSVVAPAR